MRIENLQPPHSHLGVGSDRRNSPLRWELPWTSRSPKQSRDPSRRTKLGLTANQAPARSAATINLFADKMTQHRLTPSAVCRPTQYSNDTVEGCGDLRRQNNNPEERSGWSERGQNSPSSGARARRFPSRRERADQGLEPGPLGSRLPGHSGQAVRVRRLPADAATRLEQLIEPVAWWMAASLRADLLRLGRNVGCSARSAR